MKKPKKRTAQLRVVRSLHLPSALDRKIVKAAAMAGKPVAEFIRDGAEALADSTLARAA